MTRVPVGIADLSTYSPERFQTAAELSEPTGIPERVIVEKFGLRGKHIARADEHVSDMCIAAARPLVARAGTSGIDAVMYFGSHWKDYMVWQVAPRVQEELGIEGFAFEAINTSAGAPVALRIARDMLAAEEHLHSILLVGAARESGLLDYGNARSRFAFGFGDGAVAALLRRGDTENEILETAMLTDGSFWHHVRVPAGGTAHPASPQTVAARMHFLDVAEPEDMKRRLDPITFKNFLGVCDEALERSGYCREDIGLCLPIHMKRSIHDALLAELGVPAERSIYLDEYGHMSAADPLFSLCLARERGMLARGDVVLLVAAGTGYTWAATVVLWGSPAEEGR